MSEQDNENLDSQNQAADDTQVSDTDTNDNTNDSANDSEDVGKLKELNKKLYERAKKAENEAKELKKKSEKPPVQQQEQRDEFSLEDVAVLVSKVPYKEDRELIRTWAKREGKSLEDMLSDPLVQARLKEKEDFRKTSEATNIGGSKRVSTKLTDEQIVQRFMEGKEVDPEALALARMNLRKKK